MVHYVRVFFAGQRILSWALVVVLEVAPIEAAVALYLNIRLQPYEGIVVDFEAHARSGAVRPGVQLDSASSAGHSKSF